MVLRRLDIPPVAGQDLHRLSNELGVSFALAQVLARRGLADPQAARAFLAAADRHGPAAFPGIDKAVGVLLGHAHGRTRITVHGDYDVDGVCSTAILVRALRACGADVDWHLPSRTEDGYGLSAATVERLAARGTRLLVTADCGITSCEEVALARSLGMDVVVTDHHQPRADGTLPEAPLVHPGVRGYPCPELCAGGVAYVLAEALRVAAGLPADDSDLDLVALATVADCVPLVGENRRLVREGLAALSRTTKPGLRALATVAQVDLARVDARAIGFRMAPRLNAAGRVARADAALELVLTDDAERARRIAEELDRANHERRHTETRILFEAEAQVARLGDRPAYVLAGEDWHPGVIGIVASRIAERHHRPVVLVALDGDQGTGSGRSIPPFDLLGGLDAAAAHLLRHGGHRAAAGCTIARDQVDAFRAAFEAHAAAVLTPEDLIPTERVDVVVAGDELGTALAEELERLAPFGQANPEVSVLVPAARLVDARPMGEGKHCRFTVLAGGVRARAVAFGRGGLPEGAEDGPLDATFDLELNEFQGAVEPRLVLRHAQPPAPEPVRVVGEPLPGTPEWLTAVLAAANDGSARSSAGDPSLGAGRTVRDRRGGGPAGTIAALVATGEPVLVVAADAPARAATIGARIGGLSVCSWDGLAADPGLADAYVHVAVLDPPPDQALLSLATSGHPARFTVLAWGDPELRYGRDVLQRDTDLRPVLAAAFRVLRDAGPAALGDAFPGWPAPAAGRALRVLVELGLVGPDGRLVPGAPRTSLDRSPTFAAARRRAEEDFAWLTSARPLAA